jgi:hypothetical protein
MTDRTISQHIQDDNEELDRSDISAQRRRHLEDELDSLEKYKTNHSEDSHDPSPLELYCDANPNALECRIYED